MILHYGNKYKIILIGDSGVGKTSIMNSYEGLNKTLTRTIGTEFCQKYNEKYEHTLQIWDCAGQERFRALVKIYYRHTHGCVFVFDLSNINTLYDIKNYWIKQVIENNMIRPIFILVGNKSDLKINTDYNIIDELIKTYDMEYIETSVTLNKNINDIFNKMSFYLYNNTIPEYKNNNILEKKNYLHNMYSYC